nr:nucleotidyltransferase family protein [Poseidonibacter parvus]
MKNWDDFIALSYTHGVFPLVYHTLKEHKDILPKDLSLKLKTINMDIAKQNMLMTSELIKVMKLLEENDIEAIAFKGPTLCQLVYDDVISRQYVDIDLLIKEDYFDNTVTILKKFDYQEKFEYSIGKKKIEKLLSDHTFINPNNNIPIEIHNKLFSSDFPINLNSDIFFKNTTNILINNNSINSFSKEYLLVYLCLHGSKHLFSRISWILDIHKLINKYDLDWELIDNIIQKSDSKIIVYSSLFLSRYLLNTKLPENIKNKYNDKYKKIVKLIIENKKNMDEDKFSIINLIMFDTVKQKIFYIFYLFKPSFLDYQSLNKDYNSELLYYIIRPFNILSRFFKKSK